MNRNEIEIYIHIPFCVKKCNYCDFLSFGSYNPNYVTALLKEISETTFDFEVDAVLVRSIFIGGGTPSILEGKEIHQMLACVYERFKVADDAEITIEVNPGTIAREKLEQYQKAGINRISMGLQSTNNEDLLNLGRIHTYEQFLENYNLARAVGFTNINVDLMSAIPNQTVEGWERVLETIVSLEPEHISAYSLIIEEGTEFYQRFGKNREGLPTEEVERQMYYDTKRILEKAGYNRYEVSNYSKTGYECKHNIGYWKRINYIGFGLGASSFVNHTRYSNCSDMEEYFTAVAKQGEMRRETKQLLSVQEEMEEFMFLGLRLLQGVNVTEFEEEFQVDYQEIYGQVVEKLVQKNLLQVKNEVVCLTELGIDLSNYVMAEFLIDKTKE
jgi:oxygen-independent coproporphyrinogen-3 oxidase